VPDPLQRALVALEGLSVGDAFGERFFRPPSNAFLATGTRIVPSGTWRWTDDTAMALAIVEVLKRRGGIDPDDLAATFARNFAADRHRGYGAGAHELLGNVAKGLPWREQAGAMFGGKGSFGNGAAMRVAPLGAWFAGNLARVVEEALKSSEPTHAHPEGAAGAVAVAVAAAVAFDGGDGSAILDAALAKTPPGAVRLGLVAAKELGPQADVEAAWTRLGNGSRISAVDTVPFALWCAARHLDDYEEALWTVISAGGDIDTNAAIVGGIVACKVGIAGIPAAWREAREPLP
jgi:ADP-ribosylglycohydrolase